jgi:N-methylhydantoinase A/oxoprolinase/acetone carboxylase beta subunit
MKKEGFQQEDIQLTPFLDLRYLGQSYEITVPYHLKAADPLSFVDAFHKAHQRLYSYHHPERPVEIVNIRLKSIGITKKIQLKKRRAQKKTPPKQAHLQNQVLYHRGKKYRAYVYLREQLEPGNVISGPALIVDQESTTFLPPSYNLRVDGFWNLIMEKNNKSDA